MTRLSPQANNISLQRCYSVLPGVHRPLKVRGPRLKAVSEDVKSNASLSEEELVSLTMEFISGTGVKEDMLDDEFVFRGPVVGPLNKEQYITALNSFDITKPFPDIKSVSWGHSVDPSNPMRVWYFINLTGTMTNNWLIGEGASFPATNKPIRSGPEAHSLIWTPEGKVRYQSVGYCVDRIYSDAEGSMTAAVQAAFKAADKEVFFKVQTIPFAVRFQEFVRKIRGGPDPWDDLPEWFKKLPASRLRGGEGYFD